MLKSDSTNPTRHTCAIFNMKSDREQEHVIFKLEKSASPLFLDKWSNNIWHCWTYPWPILFTFWCKSYSTLICFTKPHKSNSCIREKSEDIFTTYLNPMLPTMIRTIDPANSPAWIWQFEKVVVKSIFSFTNIESLF